MTGEEFKKIWLPLTEQFYRVAFYILETEEDAEDAVQDLYVRLWNSRDSLASVINPKAYGLKMLKNLCLDRLRHAKVASADSLEEGIPLASEDAPPDRQLIQRDTLRRLGKLIEELPENQRKVLKMRVIEGMEYGEISDITKLGETNLRVLLSAARKTLRKRMGYEKN